jgi:hypothetical protein
LLQETTQEPNAMKSPSRNIPIRTVTVAASVVDTFAPSERSDSATMSLKRSTQLS